MTAIKSLSLPHVVRPPLAGTGAPPLLVMLHGFGSNEHDLFSMAPYLDQRFLIVSARAPYTLQAGSYAWFEISLGENEVRIDPRQADKTRRQIIQFVGEAALAYNADHDRVYLIGFSQGAIMSVGVALSRPDLVAGVVAMSGSIPPEVKALAAAPEQLAGLPFLVIHGTTDPMLPIAQGRASRDVLASLPVELTYQEYPMGHEVNAESFATVRGWLSAQLDHAKRA